MIKVGIPVIPDGANWLGGLNYFKSLAKALNDLDSPELSVSYLTNNARALSDANGNCVNVIQCSHIANRSKIARLVNFATSTNLSLAYYAKQQKLDLLTHALPGRHMQTPSLYWMPDFQHKHLSELFSAKDIWNRDRAVNRTKNTGHILFSSHSAERDFRRFYPSLIGVNSHVLRFTPTININSIEIAPLYYLSDQYDIGNDYFYLPNQFWQHKNHNVVLEALAQLPSNYMVICSGALTDYRGNGHIHNLKNKIIQLGLENRFKILGIIPRQDVYCLMEHALAVINPSLFEGWSTTVEEAKYTGKRLILSDIPVHKEQNPVDGLFFSPKDAEDLAKKMQIAMKEHNTESERRRKDAAQLAYPIAVKKFASDYVEIIKQLI